MGCELFDADGFVVGHTLLVGVVDPSQAIRTDPAVQLASIVAAQKLVGFGVFEAVSVVRVHLLIVY